MKKLLVLLPLFCLLTGCRQPKTYETMTDLYYTPQKPKPALVSVWLPQEGALETLESKNAGTLYLCDSFTVSVQTLDSGDLDATLCAVTGYDKETLRGIQWQQGNLNRYECAWASVGESGDQVGRTVVLDDGNYHYAVTVLGQADQAGSLQETWQTITDSVCLDTGSALPDTAGGTGQ